MCSPGHRASRQEEYAGVAKLGYAWMGESVIPFVGEVHLGDGGEGPVEEVPEALTGDEDWWFQI